jgi:hypothetical protein
MCIEYNTHYRDTGLYRQMTPVAYTASLQAQLQFQTYSGNPSGLSYPVKGVYPCQPVSRWGYIPDRMQKYAGGMRFYRAGHPCRIQFYPMRQYIQYSF